MGLEVRRLSFSSYHCGVADKGLARGLHSVEDGGCVKDGVALLSCLLLTSALLGICGADVAFRALKHCCVMHLIPHSFVGRQESHSNSVSPLKLHGNR